MNFPLIGSVMLPSFLHPFRLSVALPVRYGFGMLALDLPTAPTRSAAAAVTTVSAIHGARLRRRKPSLPVRIRLISRLLSSRRSPFAAAGAECATRTRLDETSEPPVRRSDQVAFQPHRPAALDGFPPGASRPPLDLSTLRTLGLPSVKNECSGSGRQCAVL